MLAQSRHPGCIWESSQSQLSRHLGHSFRHCAGNEPPALDERAALGSEGMTSSITLFLNPLLKALWYAQAQNVLLKSSGEARGFTAKVADFGLSVKMNGMETHISAAYQGTVTHMAPEILMDGRVSKAADVSWQEDALTHDLALFRLLIVLLYRLQVYAFGMTLWEVYNCCEPFKGLPHALLGRSGKLINQPTLPSVSAVCTGALESSAPLHEESSSAPL
jgi:serine/threonine protein kinase